MCYNDFSIKVVLYDLSGHTSFFKNLCLHNFDILEKIRRYNKKYIAEKDDLEILY